MLAFFMVVERDGVWNEFQPLSGLQKHRQIAYLFMGKESNKDSIPFRSREKD